MHTTEDHGHESAPQSLNVIWQHCKEIWSAASVSEAWQSFKKMMKSLPYWGIAVIIVVALALIGNSSIVVIPLAAGGFLAALYFTVKHAVLSALREHDSAQRD